MLVYALLAVAGHIHVLLGLRVCARKMQKRHRVERVVHEHSLQRILWHMEYTGSVSVPVLLARAQSPNMLAPDKVKEK